jgi:hypothetical protein
MARNSKNKTNKESSYKSFVLSNQDEIGSDLIIRDEILQVVDRYVAELKYSKNKESKIHIDEIASGVAKFYEKIRKIIDWKDDNALRRNAIERILKRRVFPKMVMGSFKQSESTELAKTMTEELIRGAHLPNHEIPKSRIDVVSDALSKYLYFLNYAIKSYGIVNVKKGNNITTFLIEIAACEIEEVLTRPVKEYGIIDAMARIMDERIEIKPEGYLDPEEKLDLLRVSVQRKLYHLDNNYIIYMYLRRKYPNWSKFSSGELKNFAENLATIKEQSETYINSKVSKKFDEITGRFSTIFILLDDVFESLKENPESIKSTIEDSNLLISLIRDHYLERRKTLQRRLRNSAIFSTLSVFISNWATFYLIEVPVARLFYEEFNLLATIIDFLLPALVMFLLVIFIKPPKDENLENVIESSKELLYKNSTYETHELVLKEEKHGFIKIFITFAYTLSTILLFVGIAAIFYYAQLPITSVIYDTFTIAITFYAALGVRKTSKELYVGEKRSFGDFLFDSFTVPLAKVGEFLSSKWKEYNVVAIFTNYLIEIPFVAILDFIELWSKFLKERKSELS